MGLSAEAIIAIVAILVTLACAPFAYTLFCSVCKIFSRPKQAVLPISRSDVAPTPQPAVSGAVPDPEMSAPSSSGPVSDAAILVPDFLTNLGDIILFLAIVLFLAVVHLTRRNRGGSGSGV